MSMTRGDYNVLVGEWGGFKIMKHYNEGAEVPWYTMWVSTRWPFIFKRWAFRGWETHDNLHVIKKKIRNSLKGPPREFITVSREERMSPLEKDPKDQILEELSYAPSERFFVHDKTRGVVGNSMMWWREGRCGYTCNIEEAHQFTREELNGMADDLVAYPVDRVHEAAELHVTQEHLIREFEIPLGFKENNDGN